MEQEIYWALPQKYSETEVFLMFIEKNGRMPTLNEWVASGRSKPGWYSIRRVFVYQDKKKEE